MNEKTTLPALTGVRCIVYTLFCILPLFGLAQQGPDRPSVHGKVVDGPGQQPVNGASVMLLGKDSTVISGVSTHEDGSYSIPIAGAGAYLIRITAVGYQPYFFRIPAAVKGVYPEKNIRLKPSADGLQTVVVVGERSAFKSEVDKKVFNVDRSLASKGGTAADALRQVPTLSIDATGQVTLRNGAPVILVDGKRTTLTLDQIPSDQIQTIEVIPNPSAKYDAQGNNGIVNIIMKKNRKPGMNGSATAVWSSLRELYGFLNMNIYQNRWNFTMNFMGHRHRSVSNTDAELYNLTDNTSLSQHGRSVMTGPFNKLRLGADFFMDEHNTFSLILDAGHGFHPNVGYQDANYLNANGQIDSSSNRLFTEKDHFTFTHSEFDYTHSFKKQGEKIAFSSALETYYGPSSGTYAMQYIDKGGTNLGDPYLQQFQGSGRAHNLTLQADYTDPLRQAKGKLEAGLKAIIHGSQSRNDFQDYDNMVGKFATDSAVSYNYKYNDNTYAGYASYTDHLGSSFTYIAGLRMERYDYTGYILDQHTQFAFHNTGLYPSLFLTQKVNDNSEFHLNYSRRVNRPQWWQISPWTNYSNPQNPQVGNPHIQSENTNLAEISYNWNKGGISLNTTLYVKNTLSPILSYNIPLSNDTLLSTFRNANSQNTYGSEIIFKLPLLKWWNATTNLNFFQTNINANNLAEGLSNNGFSWFGKLMSEMKLARLYTVQLTGNYNGANIVAQGKTLASGGLDAAIKRDFLKNNAGTIVISVSDIFNTQKYQVVTSSSTFIQRSTTKPETRVLKINFTYAFGKEKSGERKKATSVNTD